jgi:hypothetical protein
LLQIAGGIWADTVGGKQVLAFGVIWWSVATILTPVAAKLGLPFLLVARAFMGIGEVRSVKMFFVGHDIVTDFSYDLIHIVDEWWCYKLQYDDSFFLLCEAHFCFYLTRGLLCQP